ncbi:hypothetical protein PFICI_03733 [Pestalotiopsis fici W106-1]|uniref:Uncharacterized protein n=1 Tax=Pestalotiopsis fici (strain W106-1 / CGMCC3.15140) TaxID=1229662 RepID=W3XI15_PESFW|nr:uncharacterized protein PFICI_03733 [Pestalotiopsis fici W106-1]ETS85708.1 hypothetical protein PFICI_03733 [Pestalotiopsis fici W106-1]
MRTRSTSTTRLERTFNERLMKHPLELSGAQLPFSFVPKASLDKATTRVDEYNEKLLRNDTGSLNRRRSLQLVIGPWRPPVSKHSESAASAPPCRVKARNGNRLKIGADELR